MPVPEPTPQEKVLKRVLFVSAFDGWSVIGISGLGILLTLLLGDLSGLVVGALVLAGGVMELRGRKQLCQRNPAGMKLLARAQLLILGVIMVYCVARLASFDAETALASLTPEMEAVLKENGVERADVLPLVQIAFYGTYITVPVVSLLFQGGLILYYRSRAAAVATALAPEQSPLASPPPVS